MEILHDSLTQSTNISLSSQAMQGKYLSSLSARDEQLQLSKS